MTVHESADLILGTYSAAPPLPALLIANAEQALDTAASRQVDFNLNGRHGRAFIQCLAPPPHLLICGAGPDAQPVASIARSLGWRVTLVDHRPAYVVADHFSGAAMRLADPRSLRSVVDLQSCHAAVVMSHHLPSDIAYLRQLADAGAPGYVGLLGPAARRNRLASELGAAADILKSRIRGPVGFDLGAETPEAIALAITSQIHAWLAGRPVAG